MEKERERKRERLEREARWDLRHQRYRLGLKMGPSEWVGGMNDCRDKVLIGPGQY